MDNLFEIPNEWQFVDPSNGYMFPWYVLPMLEELVTWDVSQWEIFESGGGASTIWWAVKCKHVTVLETSKEWLNRIKEFATKQGLDNITYLLEWEEFPNSLRPYHYQGHLSRQVTMFDAVIADGSFRCETCKEAPWHLKEGGILIADNFQQQGIWDSKLATFALNPKFPLQVFKQSPMDLPTQHPFYSDPDGKRDVANLIRGHPHWQTAFWKVW